MRKWRIKLYNSIRNMYKDKFKLKISIANYLTKIGLSKKMHKKD